MRIIREDKFCSNNLSFIIIFSKFGIYKLLKNLMKQILVILIVTVMSIACHAQYDVFAKKDSSKFQLKSFTYYSINYSDKEPVIFSDFAYSWKNNTSRLNLYYDSYNQNAVLYDNVREEYFYHNALNPYSNFQSAIIGGSVNYLIYLLTK